MEGTDLSSKWVLTYKPAAKSAFSTQKANNEPIFSFGVCNIKGQVDV